MTVGVTTEPLVRHARAVDAIDSATIDTDATAKGAQAAPELSLRVHFANPYVPLFM